MAQIDKSIKKIENQLASVEAQIVKTKQQRKKRVSEIRMKAWWRYELKIRRLRSKRGKLQRLQSQLERWKVRAAKVQAELMQQNKTILDEGYLKSLNKELGTTQDSSRP